MLRDAIIHLQEGRQALQQHADQWINWPSAKKHRAAALDKYDQLLNELNGYLGSLGDFEGPSAAGLNDLYDVRDLLHSPQEFMEKVDHLLMNLNKANFMEISGKCARAIETLRIAFR